MTPILALFSFYDGMSNGDSPPLDVIAPRYGPALSEAQRMRWFSDFTSPIEREARRKALLKLRRIEIGLEEDDEIEELIEIKVDDTIREIVRASPPKIDAQKLADRVVKAVRADMKAIIAERRKQEQEDQEEEDFIKTLFD